ncbi:hypothetical protein J6590_077033 [Homalodisca vitripennis]|nr:hypothetical protein J6590_077033 [Homalodisca vitripennis]
MDHTERPAGVLEDTLNLFGRYVSSILRQLPIDKSYTLQQKFINEAISAKLEHESQYPSTPRCQNGTSPSMNNTTTAPVVVSNHTNTVVCPNTTSQRKRRKRKTSSSWYM